MPRSTTFIERLAELADRGLPFIQVTLVEALGSTPQDAGSKMLVDAEGLAHGTVGGGKLERQAIEVARELLAQPQSSTLFVEWNLQRDLGMTCGGTVKLFFEVHNRSDWRVVIFGAGHVARALVRCLGGLHCQLICIDPRDDWLERLPPSKRLHTVCLTDPAQYVDQLQQTDFVVCVTMGHATDFAVLRQIFGRSPIPDYVGAIGSRSKRSALIRELEEFGIAREVSGTLVCPLGLPIGNNDPAEIAISIAAQLLQRRDNLRTVQ